MSVGEDRNGGRFVFVLEPSGTGTYFARRRTVTIGNLIQEGIMIVSGLSEGELIATAGVRRLADDQEVTLLDSVEDPAE